MGTKTKKIVMPTVTMPTHDWERVIACIGTVHAYWKRNKNPREADELELIGRQIARAMRHQLRAAKDHGQKIK